MAAQILQHMHLRTASFPGDWRLVLHYSMQYGHTAPPHAVIMYNADRGPPSFQPPTRATPPPKRRPKVSSPHPLPATTKGARPASALHTPRAWPHRWGKRSRSREGRAAASPPNPGRRRSTRATEEITQETGERGSDLDDDPVIIIQVPTGATNYEYLIRALDKIVPSMISRAGSSARSSSTPSSSMIKN
jgi:hypothetical protein